MSPPAVPMPPGQAAAGAGWMLGAALGLLALAGGLLALGRKRPAGQRAAPVARPAGTALVVTGLTKRYARQLAVDQLSFAVAPGEVVALWGQNGAGKTTVLKCILGLLPCAGQVTVAGLDARRNGRAARRALGYVPQEVALHDDLSVSETVAFYARVRGVSPVSAGDSLAQLGLVPHLRKPVGALSGGLRQRLALAIALLDEPAVLLLDEPTASLDAAGRELLVRVLAELRQRGTAVVLTSHRLEEVETLADRVLVLEHGRLAGVCAPVELAYRLGLRLTIKLRVADAARGHAMTVLTAGGLDPHANGRGIAVVVPSDEKARPIRLLEHAGIAVLDFVLEHAGQDEASSGEAAS
jgi:ABC-2 type transport system ATP-binding protein/nitrous oxidase accessory protein